VRQMARDLAGKPYKPPDDKLPDNLKDLSYDKYRFIRFAQEKALWRDLKLPFEAGRGRRPPPNMARNLTASIPNRNPPPGINQPNSVGDSRRI
jgi:hypothetical protein